MAPETFIGALLDMLEYRRQRLLERVEAVRSRIERRRQERGQTAKHRPQIVTGEIIGRVMDRVNVIVDEITERRPKIIPKVMERIRERRPLERVRERVARGQEGGKPKVEVTEKKPVRETRAEAVKAEEKPKQRPKRRGIHL